MSIDESDVMGALARVRYPGFGRDIVSLGMVRGVEIDEGAVTVRLEAGRGDASVRGELERSAKDALERLHGVSSVRVVVASGAPAGGLRMVGQEPPSTARAGGLDAGLAPGIRHTIAVASGKGGVGKSTVAVNLAVALASLGARVGLLDADIYGPSIPLMTGGQDRPRLDPSGRRLVPFERHGVRLMSLGFLVDQDSALIWRGPMVMKAVEQLLRDVEWGELDVLVVDMPPGTGDAQLTLTQRVHLAGAVIVTTPQDVALADAIKGVAMFRKVSVPILGIVENMSYFVCPHCSERTEVFGHGGGRREAARLEVPFLGEIPLDVDLRASGDSGTPVATAGAAGSPFGEIAAGILDALSRQDGSPAHPAGSRRPASED